MTEIKDVESAIRWVDSFNGSSRPPHFDLLVQQLLRDEVLRLRAEIADPPMKYSRDGGNTMTIRNLIDKLNATGTFDVEKFCDVLDSEFLFGAWAHYFDKPDNRLFLKDLRGLIYAVFVDAAKQKDQEPVHE